MSNMVDHISIKLFGGFLLTAGLSQNWDQTDKQRRIKDGCVHHI